MRTILLMKLYNFRKRKPHHTPNVIYVRILSHTCRKSPEWACITITSSRLTSVLYILSLEKPANSTFLKSCHSICFVLVGVIKYLFTTLTCYINNFQLDNEKGIKVKYMKQVDGTKDDFNSIENDEICYEEQEFLCHLDPPYPTNGQMTLDFSDSDIKNIMAAIKKIEEKQYTCLELNVRLNICIIVSCNILVGTLLT